MFQQVFFKLRHAYNACSRSYVVFMLDRPFHFISAFLVITLMLSFGLFQTQVNMNTQELTYVRDSEAVKHAEIINKTFPLDQHKRHFINRLLDYGYYVEIIVAVKSPNGTHRPTNDDLLKPEYSLMRREVLDEYNKLYDTILNLEIEEYDEVDDASESTTGRRRVLRRYKYDNDLCAKRLEKCSIESGLSRSLSFQKNLLDHKVDYQRRDPKASYGDTETVDGFSFNVLFGRYRKEIQADNDTQAYYGPRYIVTHASTFRVRFDLLYTNERERYLSFKYMLKFADTLGKMENQFTYLNYSYHASQTMEYEIEKYSKHDTPFLVWFLVLFWLFYTLGMWFNVGSSSSKKRDHSLNNQNEFSIPKSSIYTDNNNGDSSPLTSSSGKCCGTSSLLSCGNLRHRLIRCFNSCLTFFSGLCRRFNQTCFKPKSICINGASFLPICLLIQFILTILATYGLISLINIETNPLTLTVLFIILINSCNQGFVLYSNVKNWRPSRAVKSSSSKDEYLIATNDEDEFSDEDDNNVKRNKRSPRGAHHHNHVLHHQTSIENTNNINIKECMIQLAQQILVPMFFSLIAITLSYVSIGTFSCFDSVRIYCLFTVVALYINFLGHLTFFVPFLSLHLRRVDENRNCFICCYSHELESVINMPVSSSTKTTSGPRIYQPKRMHNEYDESEFDDSSANTRQISENTTDLPPSTSTRIGESSESSSISDSTERGSKRRALRRFCGNLSLFDMLFNSKLKYALLLGFLAYLGFNCYILATRLDADLPIVEIMPEQSYLRKHMVNHLELYNIGPVIMFAFLKPLEYWKKSTFNRIRSLMNDAKESGGMEMMFEMNWLQDTLLNSANKGTFDRKCLNKPFKFPCFYEAYKETVSAFDLYVDDVIYDDYYNSTVKSPKNHVFRINASRVYLEFQNFYGNRNDVDIIYRLNWLAQKKYNFSKDELIIFSPVNRAIEQISEMDQSFYSLFILTLESIMFVSFFLFFDLRSIFILVLVIASCLISVLGTIVYFGLTMNIFTLGYFIMLPAFLCEFFYTSGYLFLFRSGKSSEASRVRMNVFMKYTKKNGKKTIVSNENEKLSGEVAEHGTDLLVKKNQQDLDEVSSVLLVQSDENSESNSNLSKQHKQQESPEAANNHPTGCHTASRRKLKATLNKYKKGSLEQRARLRRLKFAYYKSIKHSASFLLLIFVINLLALRHCDTYNFRSMYLFMFSSTANILLHLFVFYPAILSFSGTCWEFSS